MIPIRRVIGTAAREADVKELSKTELEALVRGHLRELGSPFLFMIHPRETEGPGLLTGSVSLAHADPRIGKDCAGRNWRITAGPVPEGQSLAEHSTACLAARMELSKDYNLEPERKESETQEILPALP